MNDFHIFTFLWRGPLFTFGELLKMDEEKEEEVGNELQLIYIYRAVSELPDIFPSFHPIAHSLERSNWETLQGRKWAAILITWSPLSHILLQWIKIFKKNCVFSVMCTLTSFSFIRVQWCVSLGTGNPSLQEQIKATITHYHALFQ